MSAGIRVLRFELYSRLRCGQHVVLYGPRGSGKSTLLAALHKRFIQAVVPCAISPATSCLDDITRTFAQAYPDVETASVTRRAARGKLWLAADRQGGVLLLDHVTHVSTAMIGALRRLRGGIAGVLFAIDIEVERERKHMRNWRLATLSWQMPATAPRRLRTMFRAHCVDIDIPFVGLDAEKQILRAAHGRPGWILQCVHLLELQRYWSNGKPIVPLLCADTEIVLRMPDQTDHLSRISILGDYSAPSAK